MVSIWYHYEFILWIKIGWMKQKVLKHGSCYLAGELRMEFVRVRKVGVRSHLPTWARITCHHRPNLSLKPMHSKRGRNLYSLCEHSTTEYCSGTIMIADKVTRAKLRDNGIWAKSTCWIKLPKILSPNLVHEWSSVTTCFEKQNTAHCPIS